MPLPTLEELISRRKQRKQAARSMFKGKEGYKDYLENIDNNTEGFLNDHLSMIEKGDQELSSEFHRRIMKTGAISLIPSISLGLYFWQRPSPRRYLRGAAFLLSFILPFTAWILYVQEEDLWLRYYLIDKYTERIAEYNRRPDPTLINRNN